MPISCALLHVSSQSFSVFLSLCQAIVSAALCGRCSEQAMMSDSESSSPGPHLHQCVRLQARLGSQELQQTRSRGNRPDISLT